MINLDSEKLQPLMLEVLTAKKVDEISARHLVASSIQTSLRGVDSHGINLFPHYCQEVDAGRINKAPKIKISSRGASVAVVDADHAFGHHGGMIAMDQAVQLCCQTGIAGVCVKNSAHFGAAAYFGLSAANKECIGIAFTNADALVKAYGGTEAFCGTNPICFTAPLQNEDPFCLDMATSLVSWNKINEYRQAGKPIPDHWAFDEKGKQVTDPEKARSLNPAGEYKGFGLGIMIDILCALLSEGPISKDIIPMYTELGKQRHVSHFFAAVHIAKFTPLESFKSKLQGMADRIRALNPDNPKNPVMVPGDPEKKNFAERLRGGIPIAEKKFEAFLALSNRFKETVHENSR